MSDDLWKRIDEAAHGERVSKAEWIRRACVAALDEPEVPFELTPAEQEYVAIAEQALAPEVVEHQHGFSNWIAGVQKYRCECGEWKP